MREDGGVEVSLGAGRGKHAKWQLEVFRATGVRTLTVFWEVR
jgi:hypothetical protein